MRSGVDKKPTMQTEFEQQAVQKGWAQVGIIVNLDKRKGCGSNVFSGLLTTVGI